MRLPSIATLILAGLLSASPALAEAGHVVEFAAGRFLEVRTVAIDGDLAWLTLPGGGQIAVDASRLVRWEPLAAAPIAAVAVQPAVMTESLSWRAEAGIYAPIFERAAERHGLDPALLTSVAVVESALNPDAVSPKGAVGLLQLMPQTAERFGVNDRRDPAANVDAGARYLSWLMDRFEGRTELALAGYNAGEGAVDRHRGIPPYRETRDYVQRVMAGFEKLGGEAR